MRAAVTRFQLMAAAGVLTLALGSMPGSVMRAETVPTFSKNVAPIFYSSCVECHRPSGMAPMSLMTYEEARPWARAIKRKVELRQMPPWHADPSVGKFSNDISLTADEIDTIVDWAEGGAPEGDRRDLPKAPVYSEGWSIGKPDYIFKMPVAIRVPADGALPYVFATVPTNLTQDIWVRGIELRPTDRRVVHHIVGELTSGTPTDLQPKVARDPALTEIGSLGGLLPGRLYSLFPDGEARRIPAGSSIVLQMHYTSIGQQVIDQTEVGVVLASGPPEQQRRRGSGQVPNTTFVIPPGHPNYEVTARTVFQQDTHLTQLYPHLHVRGKDVMFKAVFPDGNEEVLLRVPKYDFNWQTSYELAAPKFMPRGTTLVVVAHFDNSTANPYNPDASAEVRWGDQTWEEMLIGYYETVD